MTQTPEAGKEITPLVIADLQKRSDAGLKTYGVRLQTHNGRLALQDWYEELLDACCYAKQEIEERRALLVELRDVVKGCGLHVFATPYTCGLRWFEDMPREYCGKCRNKLDALIHALISSMESEG